MIMIIIGNKKDLERRVTKFEAQSFAKANRAWYFEMSARSGKNIHESFYEITEKLDEFSKEYLSKLRSRQRNPICDNEDTIFKGSYDVPLGSSDPDSSCPTCVIQ